MNTSRFAPGRPLTPRPTDSVDQTLLSRLALMGDSLPARRFRSQLSVLAPHLRTALMVVAEGLDPRSIVLEIHRLSGVANLPLVETTAEDLNAIAGDGRGRRSEFLAKVSERPLWIADVDQVTRYTQELLGQLLDVKAARGGTNWLVASSPRPLHGHPYDGISRELAQRLTAVTISVPTLAVRRDDLRLLTRIVLETASAGDGDRGLQIEAGAQEWIEGYEWPGNLREFIDVLTRARAADPRGFLTRSSLEKMRDPSPRGSGDGDGEAGLLRLQDVVNRHMLLVLQQCEGNKLRTADVLGISRSTLYRMLEAVESTAA